jgi:hypothetical protein
MKIIYSILDHVFHSAHVDVDPQASDHGMSLPSLRVC